MKILRMIGKDLKILLSDKKALAIMILMPVILTTILSLALKGVFARGGESGTIPLVVVKMYDRDQDEADFLKTLQSGFLMQGLDGETRAKLARSNEKLDGERIFFEEFLGSPEMKKMITYHLADASRARQELKEGKVAALLILPEHFIYDMKMNMLTPFRNQVELRVVSNPEQQIRGQIVHRIVAAFADTLSSVIIGKNVLIETALERDLGGEAMERMETLVESMSDDLKKIRVDVENMPVEGKRQVSSFDYYGAAIMAMFILFAAGHGGRLLLEEKQNTTYQRMVIAGTSKLAMLTGKFFTVFLFVLIQTAVMITFSGLTLKVHWGNMLLVTLISLCAAFAVAGAGLLIAVAAFRAENDRVANIFETAVIQTMALLGGSFIPVELLPSFMQKLSIFSLNGIALKSYLKVMMGYGFDEIRTYLFLLVCVGTALTLGAIWLFYMRGRDERCAISSN
ncbi:ABC transporter permease [Candidatus Formimonas warabiya]|uniref:ABC-2 type transporter transmembrane domain-containing protein n=1 Tax=Formimonas warabiya TaxID=1761012 RepID=A0A3G1KRR4_FORW1|nr:ABC transporter permease [Candidatus Formimonas warabiya]ATW25159.1 hypothetical protein DCMF_10605 [Candidatus Formimonas warabiya]